MAPSTAGFKLPQLLAQLPNNGIRSLVRRVVVPRTPGTLGASSGSSSSPSPSPSSTRKSPSSTVSGIKGDGGGEGEGEGGEGPLYLVTRSKLKFRPVPARSSGSSSSSSTSTSASTPTTTPDVSTSDGEGAKIGGVNIGEIEAHGKAWGLLIRKGRFDIPSGRTNKPDPEITKALKGRWIAVDRNTLSPELQALVNDAKVDGILENRTQRREKALAELQQGKKDRIAAEAGSKA